MYIGPYPIPQSWCMLCLVSYDNAIILLSTLTTRVVFVHNQENVQVPYGSNYHHQDVALSCELTCNLSLHTDIHVYMNSLDLVVYMYAGVQEGSCLSNYLVP